MNNDELYHYGVKGMKWGVRKAVQNANRSFVNASRSLGRTGVGKAGIRVAQKSMMAYGRGAKKINNAVTKAKKHKETGKAAASKVISKNGTKKVKDLENWTVKDRYNPKNLTKSMSVNDMARAGYFGKVGRKMAATKSASKASSKMETSKDLENWTVKDRYNPKNLTKSMSVNDMARAGYFGKVGRAVAKKKKR